MLHNSIYSVLDCYYGKNMLCFAHNISNLFYTVLVFVSPDGSLQAFAGRVQRSAHYEKTICRRIALGNK